MDMLIAPTVEMHFPIQSGLLPSAHGYSLYGAISRLLPSAHDATWLGIHTIVGILDGTGMVHASAGASVRIRLPLDQIPQLYELAGKELSIGSSALRLGIPSVHILQPSTRLWSRLVLIKCKGSEGICAEPETFLGAAERQLDQHGIKGNLQLERARKNGDRDPYARRVLRIKGTTLTGYGVYVDQLSEEDSLKLQTVGLGGKRKMGCGLFVPAPGH